MIVNELFSKSSKRLNFIVKKLNRNTEQKRCKERHKKRELQTCLKGGKFSRRASKRPAKLLEGN